MLSNNTSPQQSHPAKTLLLFLDPIGQQLSFAESVARGKGCNHHYFFAIVVVLGAIAFGYFAAFLTVYA